jgi:hypothetical protein
MRRESRGLVTKAHGLQDVSKPFHTLAHEMANSLPPNPETTAGLRKLLEAKDCMVRAASAPAKRAMVAA